jgi:hypothetical protein
MAKARCVCDECGLPRNRVVPVFQHHDGRVETVCVPCYRKHGYAFYMWDDTNASAGIPQRALWNRDDDYR